MKKKETSSLQTQLRVAIVEDHILIRKSMVMLIDSFAGIKVVLDVGDGITFLEQLKTCAVDIVLLDLQMPKMNGFETCKKMLKLYPEIKVLVVSQLTTKQSIYRIMSLGAHGYFTKNSAPEELETAIRSLHENGYYFGSELGSALREAILWDKKQVEDNETEGNRLTDRELQVMVLMCKELSTKEISAQLFISPRSVDNHRGSIMQKTCSQNVTGIVLYALKRGLVSLDEL